eukprot:gene19276-23045_t
MAYQQGGMDKLVAQLRNESYNPFGSIQQQVQQQSPQQIQQRQVSLQYRQDPEPIEQYGKYGASNYSSTTFGGHNNHEMLQTSNVLGQTFGTPTQSYGTPGQMNPITDMSSQMEQSALLEQQYQQLQLMQAAQMQAVQKQAQQQAQLQAVQMQSSMQMQPIQKFNMMNSMRQPSQPTSTSVEDLISGELLSKKIKKDLFTALVVNDFEFHDTVTQIIHAQDVCKTILGAGKRRVINLLQKHVSLKVEPQVEGLKVWTGLPMKTKEALKANFVSKRFKEAVEEVVTNKDFANKLVVCGREWMKTRMWETFKEEVSFVQTAKRPREEGDEPQGAPELEPQKSTRTGRTVFLSLTNKQRVELKLSLEKQPFAKAFDALDLCPSDKVLLTGAGAEMIKSLFKQTMGVEPKAYTGKVPPKTFVKDNGSDAFAKLTEDQKVFLKDELQVAGFKATLDQLEQPAAMVESLLKDGREVLKTRLKGHFKLQELEFYKKPTRDEEAKAKFTALPDNVKQELQ